MNCFGLCFPKVAIVLNLAPSIIWGIKTREKLQWGRVLLGSAVFPSGAVK